MLVTRFDCRPHLSEVRAGGDLGEVAGDQRDDSRLPPTGDQFGTTLARPHQPGSLALVLVFHPLIDVRREVPLDPRARLGVEDSPNRVQILGDGLFVIAGWAVDPVGEGIPDAAPML